MFKRHNPTSLYLHPPSLMYWNEMGPNLGNDGSVLDVVVNNFVPRRLVSLYYFIFQYSHVTRFKYLYFYVPLHVCVLYFLYNLAKYSYNECNTVFFFKIKIVFLMVQWTVKSASHTAACTQEHRSVLHIKKNIILFVWLCCFLQCCAGKSSFIHIAVMCHSFLYNSQYVIVFNHKHKIYSQLRNTSSILICIIIVHYGFVFWGLSIGYKHNKKVFI